MTTDAESTKRRHSGRLEQEMLVCQYGPVMNLSAGGMRVISGRTPSGEVNIELVGLNEVIMIRAKVAWKKRAGLFKKEIGFEFVDVPEALAKKLTALATSNRIKRVM